MAATRLARWSVRSVRTAASRPSKLWVGFRSWSGSSRGYRTFEISDRTPNPGRYRIVVRDTTSSHNWHLYGNGKSVKTTVRGTGRWVFKIRLTRGTYRVVCDPHNDEMEFNLVVG